MDSAFGWLGQVMDAVICIFPRREVLEDTHGGVRYRFGKREELPTDGRVLWYWPLVTKIRTYPHILQTCNLENQTLTTKDGHTIGLSGIVRYQVPRPFIFLTQCWDGEDTIRDIVLSNISDYIENCTLQEFRDNFRRVKQRVRRALEKFGIQVEKVSLSHSVVLHRVYGIWPAGGDPKSGAWLKGMED